MDTPHIRILSVGTALPGPPVDNAALARRFGMDALWEQWVDAFIGTRHRHLAVDIETGEIGASLSELGVEAGRRALESAGVRPEEIDLVVMATATPEQLMPATVNVICDALGIDDVATYQLQSGCSGAVQALDVAHQLLQTGRHRTALVIGGDVLARFYDCDARLDRLPPDQLVNYVLFGDGAGAAVLSADASAGRCELVSVRTRLTGLNRPAGATMEWFGPVDRDSDRPAATEDYKAIETRVPEMSEETLHELLDDLDWRPEDVTYLLPPQLSGRMTRRIVERLGAVGGAVGAEEVSCVNETGNNANALVFFQLERALERLAPGERAIGIAIESSKWIKAGFALEGV
ncbi:3-oxoacyl-ACP synthase III family protein [Streptomyces lavendulae]|uniref:3-oxoacyl-ACP synthase III family protein n=1 Tax=Streptomyces TaxID=1883 RepID=UPI0024746CED|nr:3-oxoacyl-ACP synthase III family protein [Streptomyces sp. SPB4]MDH6544965.1 3-oxoacyl-[acyl-carrier-protein] synthase-3 [Streptomyces sp. SPB4]